MQAQRSIADQNYLSDISLISWQIQLQRTIISNHFPNQFGQTVVSAGGADSGRGSLGLGWYIRGNSASNMLISQAKVSAVPLSSFLVFR